METDVDWHFMLRNKRPGLEMHLPTLFNLNIVEMMMNWEATEELCALLRLSGAPSLRKVRTMSQGLLATYSIYSRGCRQYPTMHIPLGLVSGRPLGAWFLDAHDYRS